MNVNASAYPTPNRADLLGYLKTMQSNAPDEPLVQNAARHLDEFRADSGEQLLSDIEQARASSKLKTAAGVVAGAAVALIGWATGNAVAGVVGGAAIAGTALMLGSKRQAGLDDFGMFIGGVNVMQVLDGKFDEKPEARTNFAQAEPMPDGWRASKKPATDVLIDMAYDPGKKAYVAHTIHEFERPPQPPPPETRTIIDMTPDGRIAGIQTYQV